jgi:hypothetical protein
MFIEWKATGSQNNFWIIIQKDDDDLDDHLKETTGRYDSWDRNRPPWPKFVMEYDHDHDHDHGELKNR